MEIGSVQQTSLSNEQSVLSITVFVMSVFVFYCGNIL